MAERFNIERFMDASNKLDLSDIDWSEVPRHKLTEEALRTLRYFLITESSTFFYAKTLMTTRSVIEEPDFAPFVSAWVYEEEFHGRAFRRFMEAYGAPPEASYRSASFSNRGVGERIDELGQRVLGAVFAAQWPAVHMVWGTIQEFTTYTAYTQLIQRINHPILTLICQRIMKQELRHFAFYASQARRRLAESEATRKVVRGALKLGWTPVGDGMCPKSEVLHAIRFLFDGRDGPFVRQIEARVRELPGLEEFDMFTKFVERHDIRSAPRAWMPNALANPHVALDAVA